jgi:HTH-type transcriptional regulator, transcriptional repressor of NAD biosynthesis genes
MSAIAKAERGFLLGKFMPPHQGHVLLCAFAQNLVQHLTILVCSQPDDDMPGAQRFAWMCELFPRTRVLWCNETLPQAPEDDPENFWPIWREVVQRYHPEPIDFVFASESYGERLAEEAGARFAPCDIARHTVPISASAIRADPFANWVHIPPVVRPYFTKRVCVTGPESSGKTTLAAALAEHYDTVLAPEYGRIYTETFGVDLDEADLQRIAEGQIALSAAAARTANRIVVEDTDAVLTAVWSDMLLERRSEWFGTIDSYADLYLLCDADFPWVDDGTRYFAQPEQRRRFFDLCVREFEVRGVRYVVVSGSLEQRIRTAREEIARRFGI